LIFYSYSVCTNIIGKALTDYRTFVILSGVAIGYPASVGKKYFSPPPPSPTKTAEFKVKNRRKVAE